MTAHSPHEAGFTLIELLISLAISLLLIAVAFAAFRHVRTTISRTTARVDMHQRSEVAYRGLRSDVSMSMPNCALFARSIADDPATPDVDEAAIELVFMRGKIDNDNWDWTSLATINDNSDLLWTQWRWARQTRILSSGVNRWQRTFTIDRNWAGPGGSKSNMQGLPFVFLPLPLRTVDAADPWSSLDQNLARGDAANRSPDDLGDGEDLQRETRPLVQQVSACTLQLVTGDGATVTFDGATARTMVFNGIAMDGKLVDADFAKSDIARRPRLVRLTFTLHDELFDFDQTFTYSVQFPGILPGPPP